MKWKVPYINFGRQFKNQAHIRIILQDVVSNIFKKSAGFDVKSIMKKLSHAQENKQIFSDVFYNPPFPSQINNLFVIDRIEQVDPSIAIELKEIDSMGPAQERYLSLIFQYFLNSVFADKIFKSIKPTVEAFCGKKFNAFHSLLIKLFFFKKFLKPSIIYSPLSSSNADSPIIIIGFFEEIIFFENSESLVSIFFISSVVLPIIL